jgi:hypothetical protein
MDSSPDHFWAVETVTPSNPANSTIVQLYFSLNSLELRTE